MYVDSSQPVAKIADFGNSRFVTSVTQTLTQLHGAHTYYYLAPEVDQLNPQYTEKVDIFSLGHMCLSSSLKLVIVNLPGISKGPNKVLSQVEIRADYFLLLRDIIGNDHQFEALIEKCLEYHGSERPSAAKVTEQLKSMRFDHTPPSPPTISPNTAKSII